MKRSKTIGGLLVGLVFCFLLFYVVLQNHGYVYPTPETQSTFLKEYTPQRVVESFRLTTSGASWSNGRSSGAGKGFADQEGDYQGRFAIWPKCSDSLMTALGQDVAAQLTAQKALFHQNGDPTIGFHFDYRVGKTFGFLDILPLRTDPVRPVSVAGIPLIEDGATPVILDISIHERYFPDDPVIAAQLDTVH
jgi:hypothetical protein